MAAWPLLHAAIDPAGWRPAARGIRLPAREKSMRARRPVRILSGNTKLSGRRWQDNGDAGGMKGEIQR